MLWTLHVFEADIFFPFFGTLVYCGFFSCIGDVFRTPVLNEVKVWLTVQL